jgi:hypothetical protein
MCRVSRPFSNTPIIDQTYCFGIPIQRQLVDLVSPPFYQHASGTYRAIIIWDIYLPLNHYDTCQNRIVYPVRSGLVIDRHFFPNHDIRSSLMPSSSPIMISHTRPPAVDPHFFVSYLQMVGNYGTCLHRRENYLSIRYSRWCGCETTFWQ